jgi:signal transduction histidine kinase
MAHLSRTLLQGVGIAGLYAALGRLGLLLDAVGGFATVVWAPSGVAIAAVMLLGYRMAGAVWLGALIANALSGAPVAVAACIGVGNTLEAVLAVSLLRRARFRETFDDVMDVLKFAAAAAVLSPIVAATIGVATLYVSGLLPAEQMSLSWRAWWVGDSIGALLVAPAILIWRAHGAGIPRRFILEAAAVAVALLAVTSLVFFSGSRDDPASFLKAYLIFPVMLWASMRFEQRGATAAILLVSVVALIGTAQGHGPFAENSLHYSLFGLQTFMGIVAVSFLMLATASAQRTRAERAVALALASAAEANRAKSDFLAAMSHELRTPLNAISGYAQLLSMEMHGPLTEEQRDAIRRIESNQRHLASLLADVLSFTAVETGRLALHPTRVTLSKALQTLPQFVDPDVKRKGVSLHIHPVDDALVVDADPDRLRQILLNLLVNAIKYTDEGGRVEVEARADRGVIRIDVKDTGIGIPAEQLGRVFEPFFQVDRGHRRRYGGVGLGLTISRDLARAMGGDVVLTSTDGAGTVATLELPVFASERQRHVEQG